jgi:RNA polymerase sigma-70 factor, ECF subfamily
MCSDVKLVSAVDKRWNPGRDRCSVVAPNLGAMMGPHGRTTTPLDEEVHQLVATGREREAADLLLTQLSPELRPFLHRLLGDGALADEALSATGERLWLGLGKFRWDCSLRSWSYIVARREASRCRNRHRMIAGRLTTLSSAEEMAAPRATSERVLSTTRRDILEDLRAKLSDEDRDLLVLRVERGLAWKDIAAAFLEEDVRDDDTIRREAARLRQRYRAIRVSVAAAMAAHRADAGEPRKL